MVLQLLVLQKKEEQQLKRIEKASEKQKKAEDKAELKALKNSYKAKIKEMNAEFKESQKDYALREKIQSSTSGNEAIEKYKAIKAEQESKKAAELEKQKAKELKEIQKQQAKAAKQQNKQVYFFKNVLIIPINFNNMSLIFGSIIAFDKYFFNSKSSTFFLAL